MLPLQGLRIVELGHYIAGPFATRLLADLGAEVIKVEPPEGDPIRGWGEAVDGHALWFSVHGRNKRCVTLDLKSPEGQRRVRALLRRADALVENFRPGYLERTGLGPEELRAENPRLVVVRVSGYGQDGPYRDKPAFGAMGEAMGGLRHLTASPGQDQYPPPRCGVSISDDLAGMYAALALVAACWGRDRQGGSGVGTVADVDLVSSVFSLMEGMLPEYGRLGRVRQPAGAAIPTASPTNTYPCSDGKWLAVAGNSDPIFTRLMRIIGRSELAADPRFATNGGRVRHAAELDAAIAEWTRTLPAAEAQARLDAADVPCSRLYDVRDCVEDPHFAAREMILPVEDPILGTVLHPAAPFRFQGVSPRDMVRWTGPAVGADNDAVFRELEGEAAATPAGNRPGASAGGGAARA
ncbi:CaiB/BaiF CoA transferase family protein [Roseomonas sp. BN140053]|uniref:CaiB/BaiF CoA transferase family protein n=1 Tax=Roseomonas sp. BN140053 TaxID=3391898 RepID=UPI0039EC9CB6